MLNQFIRRQIGRHFTRQKNLRFENRVPENSRIEDNLISLDALGIYLHVPFCQQLCPYCPYNKEIFSPEQATRYVRSVKKEVDRYAEILGDKRIDSFYIGGGTPTTLLDYGIEELIEHIYTRFRMDCKIHMESHPNHLSNEALQRLRRMGVGYISIGVEAFQDHHLRAIGRNYSTEAVKKVLQRTVEAGFECVNIDIMFDLPGQTRAEIQETANEIVRLGVDQVATYPLFNFTYTRLGRKFRKKRNAIATMFRRRKLLKVFEKTLYQAGFERSSVWAFTRKGVAKYCSVTVPAYLGLGASGASYLNDLFYVNTFDVGSYIEAIEGNKSPIALSIDLNPEMQKSGWLYWRLYETKFRKADFLKRFGMEFDEKYGSLFHWLKRMGYIAEFGDSVRLTDRGSYWIHAFEDFFSIDYINKLWGSSAGNPWPESVKL